MEDIWYVGTELKFALTIESEGFNINTDPWTATVINGKKEVKCTRGNGAVIDTQGQWYITVDTNELGAGTYYLVVEIDIPDHDFPDDYRHEVLKQKKPLANVERP